MTDNEARDQLLTIVCVGDGTSATFSKWAIKGLAGNPALAPPIVLVSGLTRQPLTLGENYFPADTLIVPVIQSVHRQPDLYDDLESFRRERFLQQRPISPLSIRGEKPVHFDAGPSSPATAPPCAPVDPSDIEVVRVRIAQDPS